MKYDVEAIRKKVNERIADLRKACDEEDWATIEEIVTSSLYASEEDIPQVKSRYKVTLKRVLTNTVYVEAYDEDDAECIAQDSHIYDNMNKWDFDEDLEPEVEEED